MVHIENEQGVCVARLIPRVSVEDVHSIINKAQSDKAIGVVVDMKNLDVLTSLVTGLLIALYKDLKEIELGFGVLNLGPEGREQLEFSQLNRLFPYFDTLSESIRYFKGNKESLTLHLTSATMERLRKLAQAENNSVEQTAIDLLKSALDQMS